MNIDKLTSLLKDFYSLTGIKTCLYDADENEICYYPYKLSPFCELLRKNSEMNEKCLSCDKNAFFICKKTYKQYFYKCHSGLIECVSPIIFDKEIIGYIVLGQIKNDKNSLLTDFLPSDFSEKVKLALIEKYNELPVIGDEKISSAINILDACAGYEYLKTTMKNNDRIDLKIAKYVRNNLTNDLSVSALCREFQLSHGEIYAFFKEFFNLTPADYVKKSKLEYACKLLKETNLPINAVAKKCGIPDYNYFSKIFKKEFGTSPRYFRKNA